MRNARYHRLRGVLYLLVGLSTAGFVFLIWGFGTLDSQERQTIDARFSIRGTQPPPTDIVFVAIDDVTTDELPVFPFPRSYHAKLIDRIAADHPKAIAVDIQFTEQTNPRDDSALLNSVANAGNVILATTETLPNGETVSSAGTQPSRRLARGRRAASFRPTPRA